VRKHAFFFIDRKQVELQGSTSSGTKMPPKYKNLHSHKPTLLHLSASSTIQSRMIAMGLVLCLKILPFLFNQIDLNTRSVMELTLLACLWGQQSIDEPIVRWRSKFRLAQSREDLEPHATTPIVFSGPCHAPCRVRTTANFTIEKSSGK
jgi:hypothetical protein